MAHLLTVTPAKTYATKANAQKAVKKAQLPDEVRGQLLTYILTQNEEGRWYPVFIGERAIQAGVHHLGFCIIG